MYVSRRQLLLAGTGCAAAARLNAQPQPMRFTMAPLTFRDETNLLIAAFATAPCHIEITLTGREPIRTDLKAEQAFSRILDGIPKAAKLERILTVTPLNSNQPRFAAIFEPGAKTPSAKLEDQTRHVRFMPQPVGPNDLKGDFLVPLDSPASVYVEIRKANASRIVRFYRMNDRPQGTEVPILWDIQDDAKKRVPPGQYAADLTLNWKSGLSPKYVVSSVQVNG